MISLVLFDIDGTLIRTGGAGVKAFERTFATEFGVPQVTRGLQFAGRTDTSLVRECFQRMEVEPSPVNFHRFFDTYVFWLNHFLTELKGEVCPGVRCFIEGLQRLPQPPVLGLLTGNVRLGAEIKLRHFSLWDHFKTGAFGDDHENRNQLSIIARERGSKFLGRELGGSEILVIGDTPLDIECGCTIQARVLAVSTGGYTREILNGHPATWVVDDLTQIAPATVCFPNSHPAG